MHPSRDALFMPCALPAPPHPALQFVGMLESPADGIGVWRAAGGDTTVVAQVRRLSGQTRKEAGLVLVATAGCRFWAAPGQIVRRGQRIPPPTPLLRLGGKSHFQPFRQAVRRGLWRRRAGAGPHPRLRQLDLYKERGHWAGWCGWVGGWGGVEAAPHRIT